jgi:hypothetical protein
MIPLFIKSIQPPKAKPKDAPKPKETSPAELGHFADLLGLLSNHRSGGEFGPHNVEAGHHVAFRAGAFSGSGEVTATGRDGLVVRDGTGREHRVHWRECTGHFAPEKKAKKK